jgi:two-component system LytT family response regulator
MIRILLIEDEESAAKRLQKMVTEISPDVEILNSLDSIAASVQWLQNNSAPDLIIMDIHLADGSSFEIFKQVNIECPVIFTTAYDQYALEAFKVNSIDYLLKPIKKEELQNALSKYQKLYQNKTAAPINIENLLNSLQSLQSPQSQFRERFIIRYGEHMKTIQTTDVAYFYTENRISFAVLKEGKRYPVDFNLDELEKMLDPKIFFRINRQFIISYHSIIEMLTYSKSRVLVKLNPPTKEDTIVSTERSSAFKSWLAGE